MRGTLLAGVLACAGGCGGATPTPPAAAPSTRPLRQGFADAEADIAAGKPAMLIYGYHARDVRAVDRETGLPLRSIAECVVPEAQRQYASDYNSVMRTANAQGRVTRWSYRAAFVSREQLLSTVASDGVELSGTPGDASVLQGDRFDVRYRRATDSNARHELYARDRQTGVEVVLTWAGAGQRVALGPHGCCFISGVGNDVQQSFDVATGLQLQEFRNGVEIRQSVGDPADE